MNPSTFDSIARVFAARRTRRATVLGGIGLGALASIDGVFAQDATPEASPPDGMDNPHPSADASTDTDFLFVQTFSGGTWAPKDGEDGDYTLTLSGAAATTVYFSDRPERIVGISPTQRFLDGLGFSLTNPPNAAVVASTDGGEEDILVIELFNPVYDPDAATLTYDARVLADYGEAGLSHVARQQTDYELSEAFDAGSLFIDGCTETVNCSKNGTSVGQTKVTGRFDGESCHCCQYPSNLDNFCSKAFPQCGTLDCVAERA